MDDFWRFIMQQWPLLVADFRREYRMTPCELAGVSVPEFRWLLQGLSEQSRFARAWADAPKHVYSEDDIAAVTAAARR